MKLQKIFFSAGDPSGDQNCRGLIRELRRRRPECELSGLGGPAMQEEGFQPRFDFPRFNRMGYGEVLTALPFFLAQKARFCTMLQEERPDLLVCVDYSGFNRPLMKYAHSLNIPVVWFIAPMIWAWKRRKHGPFLGRYAAHIACILPFEPAHWKEFTHRVSFVGNPLFEASRSEMRPRRRCPAAADTLRLALVPGSREQEVRRILPAMIAAVTELKAAWRGAVDVQVSRAPSLDPALLQPAHRAGMTITDAPLDELCAQSDLAVVQSGTATLQAAFQAVPHVVVYATSFLTYQIVKMFLKKRLRYISLTNIMADAAVVPELIQDEVCGKNIARALRRFWEDPGYFTTTCDALETIAARFESRDSASRLVDIIEETVSQKRITEQHG
ncbi:MAG: lipid-A-disaccharide synthase [Fibrobacterota bacterium]